MSEQVENPQEQPLTAAATQESGQSQGKTFTQAELNAIIAERLEKAQKKFADYDDLKKKAAKFDEQEQANLSELEKAKQRIEQLTPLETEALTLREKVQAYEQAEEKRLKTMLEGIPKEKHKLIPDGLSTPQKLAWLEVATAEGVFAPNKPRPQGNLDAGAGTGGTENSPIPPDDIKRRLRIGGN